MGSTRSARRTATAGSADDETGEVSEARVLARFGDVPDDLDQMVSG